MDYLFYWKRYANDMTRGPLFKLNQNSPKFAEVMPGDTVWAVARLEELYFLAAQFHVTISGTNGAATPDLENGLYFVTADPANTKYFETNDQARFESLLRSSSVGSTASKLGTAYQGHAGVRRFTNDDRNALIAYADTLKLDPILSAAYSKLALAAAAGTSGKEAAEKIERRFEAFIRDQRNVRKLKQLYGGACQLCGSKPFDGVLGDISEAHHIEWLSRGGADTLTNMVLVCPNHHSAIHLVDAGFDRATHSFLFGSSREALKLNSHL